VFVCLFVCPFVRPSICPFFRLSDRPSTSPSIPSFRQVQIHCQNQDWMHDLEVRDDFSFIRKKKGKKNLT
jgi:hypothetical protein